MSIVPVANGEPPKPNDPVPGLTSRKPPRPKRKGQNFAQIHSKPLPLNVHPLPAFHPSNPISLLRLAYTFLSQLLFYPPSHPPEPYTAYFSPESRSVHVTDPQHVRALWEMGFSGKGTLSRSEPSWLEREKARRRRDGGTVAAEDATNVRREERRLFKLERARLERERIVRQRMVEEGKVLPEEVEDGGTGIEVVDDESPPVKDDDSLKAQSFSIDGSMLTKDGAESHDISAAAQNGHFQTKPNEEGRVPDADFLKASGTPSQPSQGLRPTTQSPAPASEHEEETPLQIPNQEHLQLTLEEAFFLTYGLGVLSIFPSPSPDSQLLSPKSTPQPYTPPELLELFCQYSSFPPTFSITDRQPDDAFLLSYTAYHHFRSLGWVVRSGTKFAVDYLLYNRGPVFSHAEFAVLVVPAYSDRYWNTPGGRARRRVWEQKDWWWLHCVNRVQSQVKKTLVLCYVEVPSPLSLDLDEVDVGRVDVGRLLRSYKVREFVVKRWLANRSRD